MHIENSELLILDRVFQHYLDFNDNDEEARDFYNHYVYSLVTLTPKRNENKLRIPEND